MSAADLRGSQTSLIHLLEQRGVSAENGEIAIRFRENGAWVEWRWGEFHLAAQRAARAFIENGVQPGDHMLICSHAVRPVVAAIFGLWTIGAVPIQVGRPASSQARELFLGGLAGLAIRLDARFLLVSAQDLALARQEGIHVLSADSLLAGPVPEQPIPAKPGEIAFLQLTSGSTSNPRAVVVSHSGLAAHMAAMSSRLPSHADSVAVSWLPLHHDMGLVGGLLFPFFNGFPAHMISTLDFQRSPGIWLETMSRFRATIAAAPPSAYQICRALAPRVIARGCDLSAWECAMIGAEPISPSVLRDFSAAFAPAGFRPEAFFPVYGLAEATVAVTFPRLLAPRVFDRVDRATLLKEGRAVPSIDEAASVEFTGVGSPIAGTSICLHHGESPTAERLVGEICVKSDSLAHGYYRDSEATENAWRGDWLHTGDLGYFAEGQLFVTGRKKEVIIRGGQNLIPVVIEEVVTQVTGVRSGGVAAVGLYSAELGTQLVCIAAETAVDVAEHPALTDRIRAALQACGMSADRVFLFPPRHLPRTSSGKLRRLAIADELMAQPA